METLVLVNLIVGAKSLSVFHQVEAKVKFLKEIIELSFNEGRRLQLSQNF